MHSETAPSPYLTEAEAAAFLRVGRSTLRNWRWLQKGPRSLKIGAGPRALVRYRLVDLEEYLRDRTTAPSA